MAKKKKPQGLSAMNRALATGLRLEGNNPAGLKDKLKAFRQTLDKQIEERKIPSFSKLIEGYGMKDVIRNVYLGPDGTGSEIQFLRNVMLRFWDRNKLWFRITAETMTFLDSTFFPDKMLFSGPLLIEKAVTMPIYVEFPTGSPVSGAFCGCTVLPEEIVEREILFENLLFETILIQDQQGRLMLTAMPNLSAEELFATNDIIKQFSGLYKVLLYIGYLLFKTDSAGTALVPYPMQNCDAYEVHPIPFHDWQPEYLEDNGWMRSGLCSFFQFLSRKNMMDFFAGKIAAGSRFSGAVFTHNRPTSEINSHLKYLFRCTAYEWEQYHIIYRYKQEVSDLLTNQNLGAISTKGIPADLLQYMPTSSLLFYLDNSPAIAFVSTWITDGPSGLGILISTISHKSVRTILIDADTPYKASSNSTGDELQLSVCCAFFHLLTLLKENAMKKAFRDQISKGNPDSESLVPVEFRSAAPRSPKTVNSSLLRIGAPVEDVPLSVFNITQKSVRRTPKKETDKFNTYKMVPHVRRRHLHHYWVGKGENRRLEARWLAPMRINSPDSAAVPTVVRDVNG